MADEHVVYIRSTVDGAGRAACLLQWGPIQALLDVDRVLLTARELMAAAAAAETDIALAAAMREDLRADDATVGVFLREIRGRRPVPEGRPALRIAAVAGTHTGLPLVHIGRGSMAGELSPDDARDMAMHWAQAAVAAQIDVRLRYALGEWDHLTPDQTDRLFAMLQAVDR
ncbi:hypothetical protein [Streptomyces phytophilus]|uniref:hypothetical protein n=1 Tax=Streptomyces phytophilus TaxID=722715 RepID=UPI0015EFE0AF|nr:hypothetical protein [Streptomyces phytophilus]